MVNHTTTGENFNKSIRDEKPPTYLENLFGIVHPAALREVHTLGDDVTGGHVARVGPRHDDQELAWILHGPGERDAVFEQFVGRHHATVCSQPRVLVLALGYGLRQQTLHGPAEPVALAAWHAVPHLIGACVQILDPRQSVGVLVPAARGEHHTHVYGGHRHTHDGA